MKVFDFFMDYFEKTSNILEKFNQEHLFKFYDELDDIQKDFLCRQICRINFSQIFNLYEASKKDEVIPCNLIEPLPYFDKSSISNQDKTTYINIGENCIKNSEFAVVTMAGGQGTRLGYKGPKGTFELDIVPKKSLFEILCDNLKTANKKYNVTIPWYIMTSIYNDDDTKNFFKEHNYFGYPENYVFFFKQSQLPLIDINSNLILEETYKIKEASNGNGDVFEALKRCNLIEDMKNKNIKWIFFSGVDNVTLDIVDPVFLGLTINSGYEIGSKTLLKHDVNSSDWIFARRNGKPSIINCCHLNDDMKTAKDSAGHDLYREINMLAHIFSLSAIETVANKKLPYHRAFKKNTFVNDEGMKQVPESPNTFKFETFIFDAFSYFDNILLMRVNEADEFAPIKDFNGPHNPEVAKDLYLNKLKKI